MEIGPVHLFAPLSATSLQRQEAEAEAAWVEADARFQDVLDELEVEQRLVAKVRQCACIWCAGGMATGCSTLCCLQLVANASGRAAVATVGPSTP